MPRPLSDLPMQQSSPDADLYALFKGYRAQAPMVRGQMGMVLVLRHRHLDLVMSDVTRQMETEMKVMQGITDGPIFELAQSAMLFANGEAHLRRRTPVQRTFAFKLMEAMRPKVAALVGELVRERLDAGPIDFLSEIATQIPARIIAEILGIPRTDLPVFLNWIADTAEAIGLVDAARRAPVEASLTAFANYVDDLLEARRRSPAGDFLSDYVTTTARDEQLTAVEIRTQIIGLILAGSDTTRGSLCMTLAHILSHPSQWRAFAEDPDGLKKGVVSEGLRYEPVVQGLLRVAVKDFDIDDYRVPAGTLVQPSLISILRDEETYAEPDRFDITRTDHPRWHPIFGAGPHRCVGEALARAELEETLAAIARLAPRTTLAGDFPKLKSHAVRQVDQMRVAFAA
jgi:cytochrome P450